MQIAHPGDLLTASDGYVGVPELAKRALFRPSTTVSCIPTVPCRVPSAQVKSTMAGLNLFPVSDLEHLGCGKGRRPTPGLAEEKEPCAVSEARQIASDE